MNTEPITDAELADLEEMERDATGGPWGVFDEYQVNAPNADLFEQVTPTQTDVEFRRAADAHFVAACRSLLPRLVARLRAAEASKWTSVDERMPEVECPVIFMVRGARRTMAGAWLGEWWDEVGGCEPIPMDSVTHWQPLPAPPEVTK